MAQATEIEIGFRCEVPTGHQLTALIPIGVIQLQGSDRWLAVKATAQLKVAQATEIEIRFRCKVPTGHQLMALIPVGTLHLNLISISLASATFSRAVASTASHLSGPCSCTWHLLPATHPNCGDTPKTTSTKRCHRWNRGHRETVGLAKTYSPNPRLRHLASLQHKTNSFDASVPQSLESTADFQLTVLQVVGGLAGALK